MTHKETEATVGWFLEKQLLVWPKETETSWKC